MFLVGRRFCRLGGVPKPLDASNLKRVITELEQTAVAVSVMGTTTRKLKEMAALVEPIAGALVGMRPDVRRVRIDLHRRIHNAKVSSVKGSTAAIKIRDMVAGLRKVQGLLTKGLGDTGTVFKVGGFEVTNVWGYSKVELGSARNALGDASRQLARAGLSSLGEATVVLDPEEAVGFIEYDPKRSLLVMDLRRPGDAKNVYRALAARLWREELRGEAKETWGGEQGLERFQTAFSDLMSGRRLDRDPRARLQVTVGVGV